MATQKSRPVVDVLPLTPERWADFVRLFGAKGACAGCWCMWWRLPRAQWEAQRGAGNREAMKRLVCSGRTPGLLAYTKDGTPVGWCAMAPRREYRRLDASRILKPVDECPVWSAPCFFVAREHRRQGVSSALLRATVQFARQQGAPALEGYPTESGGRQPDAFVYTGLASTFRKTGFVEVARRSPRRPIMRLNLQQNVGSP